MSRAGPVPCLRKPSKKKVVRSKVVGNHVGDAGVAGRSRRRLGLPEFHLGAALRGFLFWRALGEVVGDDVGAVDSVEGRADTRLVVEIGFDDMCPGRGQLQTWLSDDEQKAWRSYVLMRRTLDTHLARHLQRECELSPSDFEILVNLSESGTGRMRAVDLGAATQWEKSRVSHHVRRMEKRELIRREDSDARYPDIAITDAGRQAIRACAPANAARVRQVFVDVLGPERLKILGRACEDVVAAIREQERLGGNAQPHH